MGRMLVSVSAMVLLAAFMGCETNPPTTPTSSSSSSSSSSGKGGSGGGEGGAGGSAGMGGKAGAGGTGGTAGMGGMSGMGGMGGMGGGMQAIGTCRQSCTVPKDCCFDPMDPNCPGAYPFNHTCINGICGAPQCAMDSECTGAGQKCFSIGGTKLCRRDCTADPNACAADASCSGTADDGGKFCQQTTQCMVDADCFDLGVCISNKCVCTKNAECMAAGTVCVFP